MNKPNTTVSDKTTSIVDFEARGKEDGMLDSEGFFTQGDWEFALDTIQNPSRLALEEHLNSDISNHETAIFLKGYLMNSQIKFTAFDD